MKQRNNMNRIISFALVLVLSFIYFSNAVTVDANANNNYNTYSSYDAFRITVVGTVY